jgi:hypothetical protein
LELLRLVLQQTLLWLLIILLWQVAHLETLNQMVTVAVAVLAVTELLLVARL